MPVGLTNYAAAYATGLLLARRVLQKLKLDAKYSGNTTVDGTDYNVEALADGPRPFYALLDVGLARTTTGNKIFAAMKGAADGGVEVPHSETRFVGYDKEGNKLNAEILRKYIFGQHVQEYMDKMKGEDAEKFNKHFAQYTKSKINPGDLVKTWEKVHKAIRADPAPKPSQKKKPEKQKRWGKTKLNFAAKKNKVYQKLAAKAKKSNKDEE